jgi:hypothetical protein
MYCTVPSPYIHAIRRQRDVYCTLGSESESLQLRVVTTYDHIIRKKQTHPAKIFSHSHGIRGGTYVAHDGSQYNNQSFLEYYAHYSLFTILSTPFHSFTLTFSKPTPKPNQRNHGDSHPLSETLRVLPPGSSSLSRNRIRLCTIHIESILSSFSNRFFYQSQSQFQLHLPPSLYYRYYKTTND